MQYRKINSPIGELLLVGTDNVLEMVGLPEGKGMVRVLSDWRPSSFAFDEAVRQLDEYFSGRRKVFDLELRPRGTLFQLAVLEGIALVPYGKTQSYQEIANVVGRPRAVRAVGAAIGRNPLPIVIPCHRVIGSDGGLTGFAGGLAAKRHLLGLESEEFQLLSF